MKLFIERENKTQNIELENEISCKEFLKGLNISQEAVILVKNGSVCLEDEILTNDDELKLLSVVSGG